MKMGNVVGEIVNVSADESVLGENGLADPAKLRPISFDPVNSGYLAFGIYGEKERGFL